MTVQSGAIEMFSACINCDFTPEVWSTKNVVFQIRINASLNVLSNEQCTYTYESSSKAGSIDSSTLSSTDGLTLMSGSGIIILELKIIALFVKSIVLSVP